MIPKGRTRLTTQERQRILKLRLDGFSLQQIAEQTNRSITSVKRVVYA
jgi:DNA-binding NarL/FixJ family response regulator